MTTQHNLTHGGSGNERIDPSTGTVVHIVGSRQNRPNLPATDCPFCVGGLETPHPYETHHFANRWPPMPNDRCEIVLYSPDHDQSFAGLGMAGVRSVIDLWAQRTTELGSRSDVDDVLIFENRGREVGATIDHPHGQIYAFDHIPARTSARLSNGWRPDQSQERLVREHDGWRTSVPYASAYPVALEIAPSVQVGSLSELSSQQRDACAAMLVDALKRIDALFGARVPYMLWINQRPTTNETKHADAWLNFEIVSPWRGNGVMRYIAAAEVSTGEYFNPMIPEDLAAALRQ
jgi:UDPglucose--hexose-1-phosphate uridylyltransferase